MNAERRRRLTVLEKQVTRITAVEERALADLRKAGFCFRSMDQAKQWLKAERTMQRLTEDEVIEAFINGDLNTARKKKTA